MKREFIVTVALAFGALAACGHDEPTSQTQTTSAFMQQTEHESAQAPAPVEETTAPPAQPKTKTKTPAKHAAVAKTTSPPHEASKAKSEIADRPVAKQSSQVEFAPRVVIGTATISSVGIAPDGTESANGEAGRTKSGYVNRSTTLGNSNSGMYTGGQGSYGGRATWGTDR